MPKLYFNNHDPEFCFSLKDHYEYMKEHGLKELELTEAKIETGNGYFYCNKYFEIGEVGESCGRLCDGYSPRNGKNGRCKHSGHTYDTTDKKRIIKLK